MKPKLHFEGRKRGGRRSSLLIVDERMRTQLAVVVSFRKMTLPVLTFSWKTGLFLFADDLLVLSQIFYPGFPRETPEFKFRLGFFFLFGRESQSSTQDGNGGRREAFAAQNQHRDCV